MAVLAFCSGGVLMHEVRLYLWILKHHFKSLSGWLKRGHNQIFQHDKDLKHTSKLVLANSRVLELAVSNILSCAFKLVWQKTLSTSRKVNIHPYKLG